VSIFNKLTKHISHAQMRQLSVGFHFVCPRLTANCLHMSSIIINRFSGATRTSPKILWALHSSPGARWSIKVRVWDRTACENVIDIYFNIYKRTLKALPYAANTDWRISFSFNTPKSSKKTTIKQFIRKLANFQSNSSKRNKINSMSTQEKLLSYVGHFVSMDKQNNRTDCL